VSGPVLSIDIGVAGAIALLAAEGQLLEVFDMPVLNDGPAGRRAVNAPLLAEIVFKSHATRAFIEFVGARPGEGAVGAFAFGRSRGVCEGVLGAAGIPAEHIAPAAWKRAVGIKPGKEGAKDAARAEAIRRWPSHASLFARVRDDGRAEAALIGIALLGLKVGENVSIQGVPIIRIAKVQGQAVVQKILHAQHVVALRQGGGDVSR
jgi:crossover junction endodeoxyribonuclease RuvC